jgi:hypothetical protein
VHRDDDADQLHGRRGYLRQAAAVARNLVRAAWVVAVPASWYETGVSASTRACTFELDPTGFVRATMRDGIDFELDDAVEAVAATWDVAGRTRRPVLVDLRGIHAQSRAARDYFNGPEASAKFQRVALLVESPLSRVIANFFLRVRSPLIETRLFTDEPLAREWLSRAE